MACIGTASIRMAMVFGMASLALCIGALAFQAPTAPPAWPPHTSQRFAVLEPLGRLDPRAPSPASDVSSLALGLDGSILSTGTVDGTLRLWRTGDCDMIAEWQGHGTAVTAQALSPDSRTFLSCGADGTVRRWSIVNPSTVALASSWSTPVAVTAVTFSPDGRTVALAVGETVEFYDPVSGEELAGTALAVPSPPVWSLAFTPDGRTLAGGGGRDHSVHVWKLDGPPQPPLTLEGRPEGAVRGLAYTADGSQLLSLDTAGGLRAWDRQGKLLAELPTDQPTCLHVAFGEGGRLVLIGEASNRAARLYRLADSWRP